MWPGFDQLHAMCRDDVRPVTGEGASSCEHDSTITARPCKEHHFGRRTWTQTCSRLKIQSKTSRCARHGFEDIYNIADGKARMGSSSHNAQSTAGWKCSSDRKDSTMVEGEEIRGAGKEEEPTSTNLMLERKRRKKMDKASVVGDAISNARNLQDRVDIPGDLTELGIHKTGPVVAGSGDEDPKHNKFLVSAQKKIKMEFCILELEVSHMEGPIFQLRIHCKKTLGVLTQLTVAIEALELEVRNASILSVDGRILNTVIVEVKDGLVKKSEELRDMALQVFSKYGFSCC